MPLAVMAEQLGPLNNYHLREHDPGPPGAGQVRIAVKAAGVSYVDVLNAKGQYQGKAPVPFIPGSECSGIVESLGDDVTELFVGQRVMASAWGGVFAEVALVSAQSVVPVPEGMDFIRASVFRISALTAWHALVDRGQLQANETLLVLGAGGATGYAAVQLGRHLGARVIASASSENKRQLAAKAGASAVVDAGCSDWRDAVSRANEGNPVDVVFDPVGGNATEQAFRCLGFNGRHLVVGFPGGIASLPTNLPLLKSASLVGVNLQALTRARPEQADANVAKIAELAAQGLLFPEIARVYPLAEFAAAMEEVYSGSSAGRIVLSMS